MKAALIDRYGSNDAVSVNEKYASAPAPPQLPEYTCGTSVEV